MSKKENEASEKGKAPNFSIRRGTTNGERYVTLWMKLYERNAAGRWEALSQAKWHKLARIYTHKIDTWPIFTDIKSDLYRRSKHGKITKITYKLPANLAFTLPLELDSATNLIESVFSDKLFQSVTLGLGLVKELNPIITSLFLLSDLDSLVILHEGTLQKVGRAAEISESHLDEIRLTLNNFSQRLRSRLNGAKAGYLYEALITKLDPRWIHQVYCPIERIIGNIEYVQKKQSARNRLDKALRLAVLFDPDELQYLQSRFELIALDEVIYKYVEMLNLNVPEESWKQFFSNEIIALQKLFWPTAFEQKSSERGCLVEDSALNDNRLIFYRQKIVLVVKSPGTILMRCKSIEDFNDYAPSPDLIGAITELTRPGNPENMMSDDNTSHVIVIGVSPETLEMRRDFDEYRLTCDGIKIMTFDEVLARLKLLAGGIRS